jgi:hypothetical protein
MNKTNTMSVIVGRHDDVADRWDLVIIPIFKKRKGMKAINGFESVEGMTIPSRHRGHVICSKEKKRIDDK